MIAPIYRHVKFVQIRAKEANHDYPDERCPTVMLYRKKAPIYTWVTAKPFGGPNMSKKTFELELTKFGVISAGELLGAEDENDVDMKIQQNKKGGLSISLTAKKGRGNSTWDEDSEDDISNSDEDSEDDPYGRKSRKKNRYGGTYADTGDQFTGWKGVKFDLK